MGKFVIPSLLIQGYVKNFESIIKKYDLKITKHPKGSFLTKHGVINNTAHYIVKGITHLSLAHTSGNIKSFTFYGPETIFPLGVVPHINPIDFEMIIKAVTDVEVVSFDYSFLRKLCIENNELAAMLLEENCQFIGYLFYQEMNNTFEPVKIRICDILYLYMEKFNVDTLFMSQEELSSLAGVSKSHLEKTIYQLKKENIIKTSRNKITIINLNKLIDNCSDYIKYSL